MYYVFHILQDVTEYGSFAVSNLFDQVPSLLLFFIILVVISYITELLALASEGKLSLAVVFKGISKIIMIFAIIIVAHIMDLLMGDNHYILHVTLLFYIVHAILKILDNGRRIGIPIPEVLQKVLAILKKKTK